MADGRINHEKTKIILVYDGIVPFESHNERQSVEYLINIVHCNAN